MRLRIAFSCGCLLLVCGAAMADLRAVMAESNLEKRSGLALENADQALKSARDAYNKGQMEQVAAGIAEVKESVELAEASLKETGKNPRKSPKWFKRAEIKTRDLLKKLEAFDREMNVGDRGMLADTTSRIRQVHDSLLLGLMEGKRE